MTNPLRATTNITIVDHNMYSGMPFIPEGTSMADGGAVVVWMMFDRNHEDIEAIPIDVNLNSFFNVFENILLCFAFSVTSFVRITIAGFAK